ncbi:hypothetical protein [Dactylosporangium sp. CA-233914]|uniref:hypothetical protein n=1 Tax=Dactylosporangium sp. CA-233914 TaxID=3239934 RepID=UPI003D8FC30A
MSATSRQPSVRCGPSEANALAGRDPLGKHVLNIHTALRGDLPGSLVDAERQLAGATNATHLERGVDAVTAWASTYTADAELAHEHRYEAEDPPGYDPTLY